jgi:hypothetical protein
MPRRADLSASEPRSASRPAVGTALALKASLAARSQKRREAVGNPKCPNCGTSTIQNAPERSGGVYWCWRCQRYPFGCGIGPDVVP